MILKCSFNTHTVLQVFCFKGARAVLQAAVLIFCFGPVQVIKRHLPFIKVSVDLQTCLLMKCYISLWCRVASLKKTTTKQNHKYANTCMTPALLTVQSFLLPPILNACINAELTSFGSFMFVLFDRWGFRNLTEEFLSQFYSVNSGRISLCVSLIKQLAQ